MERLTKKYVKVLHKPIMAFSKDQTKSSEYYIQDNHLFKIEYRWNSFDDDYFREDEDLGEIVAMSDNKEDLIKLQKYTRIEKSKLNKMDAYITEHKKIEQELGIDLSVFVEAHKGVYYKNRFNEICYCEHPRFEFCQAPADMKWHLFVYGAEELKISRYGKTWALRKEELR